MDCRCAVNLLIQSKNTRQAYYGSTGQKFVFVPTQIPSRLLSRWVCSRKLAKIICKHSAIATSLRPVEELPYRLRRWTFPDDKYSAYAYRFYGGKGDFEKWVQLRHFCTYRPEILHTPRGGQYTKSCWGEFWIFSPEKFGTLLNFAFVLRPMGRKISDPLYLSFRNCFGLILSHILAQGGESLFWLFREFKIPLTRFFLIFVCFTTPFIFLDPLKLASWNFHTPWIDDGANFVFNHSWVAPIGAKGDGSKNGVNFENFKNYSGGPRGGHIATELSQSDTCGWG